MGFDALGFLAFGEVPFPVILSSWPDYPVIPVSRRKKKWTDEELSLIFWWLDE